MVGEQRNLPDPALFQELCSMKDVFVGIIAAGHHRNPGNDRCVCLRNNGLKILKDLTKWRNNKVLNSSPFQVIKKNKKDLEYLKKDKVLKYINS